MASALATLTRAILAAVLVTATGMANAGWTASVDPGDSLAPQRALIRYIPGRDAGTTLTEALGELAASDSIRHLDVLVAHALVDDETFQAELLAALRETAPGALEDALDSAGNMHNPKVVSFRKPLERAVLATPTVKALAADLSRFGLQPTAASTEKLTVAVDRGTPRLAFSLWIEVAALERKVPGDVPSGQGASD